MESSDSGKGASSSESSSDNFLPEADEIIEASWATAPEHSKTFFLYLSVQGPPSDIDISWEMLLSL